MIYSSPKSVARLIGVTVAGIPILTDVSHPASNVADTNSWRKKGIYFRNDTLQRYQCKSETFGSKNSVDALVSFHIAVALLRKNIKEEMHVINP